jgi:hypothetical protein
MLATGVHMDPGRLGLVTRGALDIRRPTAAVDAFWAAFDWLPQPLAITADSRIAIMLTDASFMFAMR